MLLVPSPFRMVARSPDFVRLGLLAVVVMMWMAGRGVTAPSFMVLLVGDSRKTLTL